MTRRKETVREFAKSANLDVEIVIIMLQDAGLKFNRHDDIIPKSKSALVRNILNVPSGKYFRSLVHLANVYKLPELELRDKLIKEKLLNKNEDTVSRNNIIRVDLLFKEEAKKAYLEQKVLAEIEEKEKKIKEVKLLTSKKREEDKKIKSRFIWRMVGAPEEMVYLQPGDVEAIHFKLVSDFAKTKDPIEPPGIRERSLLESAVGRPHTSLGETGKYPTITMAGAALLHAIVHNHAFHNGNKRTALVALIVFLDRNGYTLISKDDDLFDYVINLSAHNIIDKEHVRDSSFSDKEMMNIAQWLQKHIKRVRKEEFCLKFRELRKILTTYGCCFDILPGNRINIIFGTLKTQVYYASEGRDVDANTIHKIRRDLGLDEDNGYDSDIFYNALDRIDDFIVKYRKPLDRLAKV